MEVLTTSKTGLVKHYAGKPSSRKTIKVPKVSFKGDTVTLNRNFKVEKTITFIEFILF